MDATAIEGADLVVKFKKGDVAIQFPLQRLDSGRHIKEQPPSDKDGGCFLPACAGGVSGGIQGPSGFS